MPQLVARTDDVEWFREITAGSGADLVEIVLPCDRDDLVARFAARGGTAWSDHVVGEVEERGVAEELLGYHDALVAGVASWPGAIAVRSRAGEPDETYAAVLAALA